MMKIIVESIEHDYVGVIHGDHFIGYEFRTKESLVDEDGWEFSNFRMEVRYVNNRVERRVYVTSEEGFSVHENVTHLFPYIDRLGKAFETFESKVLDYSRDYREYIQNEKEDEDD